MQINKIELENFKQYKETNIEFPEGLTGFIGKNGAGKSTIFEAITNAFYGRFEANKDKIRNDRASDKEPVKITLYFEDKGTRYKIIREYRGKNLTAKAQLYKEDSFIADSPREVDKELKKIIKIDYTNFKNSYFTHQKDVNSLLNSGKPERQSSLRRMLGLEKMDTFETKVKEFISSKKNEMKGSENELLPEGEINDLKESAEEKKGEIERSKKRLEKQKKLVDDKSEEYKELKEKNTQLEKIKNDFDKFNTDIEIKNSNIKNIESNLEEAEKDLLELKAAKEICEKLTPQKEKYERVSKLISELQALKSEYLKKKNLEETQKEKNGELLIKQKKLEDFELELKKYDDIDEKLNSIKKLQSAHKETLESMNAAMGKTNEILGSINTSINEKANRLEKIEKLGRDSDCPECERPLENHYDKLTQKYKSEIEDLNARNKIQETDLGKIRKQISDKENEIENLNSGINEQTSRSRDLENLNKRIAELKTEVEKLRENIKKIQTNINEIGEIKYSENELEELRLEEIKLKPEYEECLRLEPKAKEIPRKENRIKELHDSRENEKRLLAELKKGLEELKFEPEEYENVKKLREEKETELDKLKEELHKLRNEKLQMENSLKEIGTRLKQDEERRARIDNLRNEIELYEKLKLSAAAFKEKITSRELPQISKSASLLFQEITKGRYYNLRINENFDFVVTRDDQEVDLNTLSGGEKDLASLCLRIAISKRVSGLAGRSNMGFLALDEVFGSQDEDRREELLNALNRISREFKQIFVVSHNQDVQEEFPNRLMIRKHGDYSIAELAGG